MRTSTFSPCNNLSHLKNKPRSLSDLRGLTSLLVRPNVIILDNDYIGLDFLTHHKRPLISKGFYTALSHRV